MDDDDVLLLDRHRGASIALERWDTSSDGLSYRFA